MQNAAVSALLQGAVPSAAAEKAYEDARNESVRDLLRASEDGPKEPATEADLETVALDLGTYEHLIGRSQELQRSEAAGARASYTQAEALMTQSLLPAVHALEDAELAPLHEAGRTAKRHWRMDQAFVALPFAFCIVMLLATQVFLARRTRRVLNAGVLAATVLFVVAEVQTSVKLAKAHARLTFIEDEALPSILNLEQVQQAGYRASLDLGQLLGTVLPPVTAEQDFRADAERIASESEGLTPDQLISAVRENSSLSGFSGRMSLEIQRESFAPERESLLQILDAWKRYRLLGRNLLQAQRGGQVERSKRMFTSKDPEGMPETLTQFHRKLESAVAVREQAIQNAVANGLAATDAAQAEDVAIFVAFGVLIVLGFAPRIREYA